MPAITWGAYRLVRSFTSAAGDDDNWPITLTLPGTIYTSDSPGRGIAFMMAIRNTGTQALVAAGAMTFSFSYVEMLNNSVMPSAGAVVNSCVPYTTYKDDDIGAGAFAIRIFTKLNIPAGTPDLEIWMREI